MVEIERLRDWAIGAEEQMAARISTILAAI